MSPEKIELTENMVRSVLEIIAPETNTFTVYPLEGSYSNDTVVVEFEAVTEASHRIVLRRYNPENSGYKHKASREFKTLELLQERGIPAPKPLYIDNDGSLMGQSGIVMAYVPGEMSLARPDTWKNKLEAYAKTLARIHSISIDNVIAPFLMDADKEAVWFLRNDQIPTYIADYPAGPRVWNTILEHLPQIKPEPPVLIHLDYWSGNVLWDRDSISAIVDWEEAAYGDPAIDVAYARMDLFLEGLDGDEFLRIYEAATGQALANLGVWELAAAVRVMTDLDGWLTRPLMDERFRHFVENALDRANTSSS